MICVVSRLHFPAALRLDGRTLFVLWYSDEPDGVVAAADGSVSAFEAFDALRASAAVRGIVIDGAAPDLAADFDALDRWLAAPLPTAIDCAMVNACWNLMLDFARGVDDARGGSGGTSGPSVSSAQCLATEFLRSHAVSEAIYMTLFWGCNLPAVTPPGERFEPSWSDEDARVIEEQMRCGLELMRAALRRNLEAD